MTLNMLIHLQTKKQKNIKWFARKLNLIFLQNVAHYNIIFLQNTKQHPHKHQTTQPHKIEAQKTKNHQQFVELQKPIYKSPNLPH